MTTETTKKPVFRIVDLRGLCTRHDPELNKQPIAYEFSNNRKFESSDRTGAGLYQAPE